MTSEISPTDEPAAIRLAAMNLLARREHSLCELRTKLARRFRDATLVEQQLQQLQVEHLQSDARFAESFVHHRFSRGYGPARLRQEMRQRGLNDAEIAQALGAKQYDWHASAQRVLQRKFGEVPAQDVKERARRSRFMQYRGFHSEHFQQYL